ncbi:MAG: ABC transporter ATP-binding protein [Deltaproteobacteria bacterium]|nr:ABC transporter ATP-binding protein [Deltaproteobacteria bacterium]
MIQATDIYKRYRTDHGPGKWVLQGVNMTIPPKTNVGLIGRNGAGKSTLLRIIGGIDTPTRGTVTRDCRVSWPLGLAGGLQGSLSGRQNAKFVCRIHGQDQNLTELLKFIKDYSEIGDAFEEPIKTYSSGMRARLTFAISLAFDFDVYLSDELTAVGDEGFRNKAQATFKNLAKKSSLIMVTHSAATLKEFCQVGVWLHEGRAHWFDDVNEALKIYSESLVKK